MAKSKSFFGLRRGSTKSQTYQVLNGEQITKDRVIDVKNPRTRSQMVQRMVMTTAGSAYRHMAEICDHSFEGVSYGQRSYSRFMSLNTKMLIDDIRGDEGQCSYNPFGDANLYPSPFIMSRGSLKFKDTFAGFYEESNNVFIQLPTLATSETRPSVAEQATAWGLSLGDILTFPFIYQESGTGLWRFSFVRIRYNVASDSELNWETLSQCFTVSSAAEVNQALYVDNSFCLEVIVPGTADTEVYGTTILSRKSNNKWLRSNAAIVFPGATIHDPSWQEALATYPVGSDYILNGATIKGGGIKPDNTLRMITRFPNGSPINISQIHGESVLVATFNNDITVNDLNGHIKGVYYQTEDGIVGKLTQFTETYNNQFKLEDESGDCAVEFLIQGAGLYLIEGSQNGFLFDIDFDNQHRKQLPTQVGNYAISMPIFNGEDDADVKNIAQIDINNEVFNVLVDNSYYPIIYNAYDEEIETSTWFDDKMRNESGYRIKELFTAILELEYNVEIDYVDLAVNSGIDTIDGQISFM